MAKTLKQLDYSILQQCMHCGMCLPACPTYDATKRERNSPRGRIALMRAVADDEMAVTPAFAEEMSYRLGCLACQTACPAGVNYAELFETARADIEQQHVVKGMERSFWRTLTLRFLFMSPRALRVVGRLLGFYQRTGLQALFREIGLTRLLPANIRRLEPQAPTIAARFTHELIAPREEPATSRYHVALLSGCMQDLVFPDINRDTADALLANGCTVHTPPVQPCCGSLHAHNGEPALAATLARRMIDLVPPENFDAIITNAGGCGAHLRHYSALLADDPLYLHKANAWDAKIRDIHEWLIEIGCRAPLAHRRHFRTRLPRRHPTNVGRLPHGTRRRARRPLRLRHAGGSRGDPRNFRRRPRVPTQPERHCNSITPLGGDDIRATGIPARSGPSGAIPRELPEGPCHRQRPPLPSGRQHLFSPGCSVNGN